VRSATDCQRQRHRRGRPASRRGNRDADSDGGERWRAVFERRRERYQRGGNESEDGGDGGGFDVPIPNPLALWPDGLVGTILTGVIGLLVGTYGVLKALALYLGY